MRLNLISVNVAFGGWRLAVGLISGGLEGVLSCFFFSFPQTRATRAPHPRGQYYPVPNKPLLHIPHVASNYFCTSQVSHPWIYPLVTPTLSSSVCKIGLARAAISRRMGLANLGHRMGHRSDIFQYRQTSSSCRYRRSWTPRSCNCNLSTRHPLDLPH